MGARGGSHPDGLPQRIARTLFLRAPYSEFNDLATGLKREFRVLPLGVVWAGVRIPTPVVLYAVSPTLEKREQRLMVVTERRFERLRDISEDELALAAENCDTYDDFRRYWRQRTHRPYHALTQIEVFRLAPYAAMQKAALGGLLFDRLYGDYL